MKPVSPSQIHHLQTENERLKQIIARMSRAKNDWYKTLFNNGSDAIAVCETFSDFPATIVDCNDAFRALIKRKDHQIIGKDFMDLMRKGEKRKFFVQALSTNKENPVEGLALTFIDGQGDELRLEISTQFIKGPKGRIVLVTLKPENSHKAILQNGIEQLLTQSQQIFFGIVEDDILQFDYVSNSVYKLTGFSSEQLLLNPFLFWNNCHPEDLIKLKQAFKSDRSFKSNLYVRFVHHDGPMIWLEFSIISWEGKEAHELSHYAIAREVTHLQKKRRQQHKQEKYNQILFQTAQTLLAPFKEDVFYHQIKLVRELMSVDRLSFYLHKHQGKAYSRNAITQDLSVNDRTYLVGDATVWKELKDEFQNFPVIVYHNDDDAFHFRKRHADFFKNLNLKSALYIPLSKHEEILGFISCNTLTEHKRWDRTDINFLSHFGQLLSEKLTTQNEA